MKNLFVCSIIYVFSNFLFSQTLQSYSGSFFDDNNVEGIATYTFYEKDNEKIKHGNFNFSFSSNGVDRELKGEFIDGKRNGIWSSTLSNVELSTIVTGTFINGIPNGKFHFEAIYIGGVFMSMEVEFNNGLIVGDFLFENKRQKVKVIGQLTKDGFMDGEWKIIKNNKEQIQKYTDSVFVLYIERDLNDSIVLKREDYELSKSIANENLITKNLYWNMYKKDDLYGFYFQTYIWSNWDLNSVGGVQEKSFKGMYYMSKTLNSFLLEGKSGPIIKDVDGNTYKTVYIGNQHWMAENLKTTKFNDGTTIPNHKEHVKFTEVSYNHINKKYAWCYYNNDLAKNSKYGKLYNGYVVTPSTNGNKNVCPVGWHVPNDTEWTLLSDYLGGANLAGSKMKEVGNANWTSLNSDATNSSLFTGLPGGTRETSFLDFISFSEAGLWWSSTFKENLIESDLLKCRKLSHYDGLLRSSIELRSNGLSIRCLKD